MTPEQYREIINRLDRLDSEFRQHTHTGFDSQRLNLTDLGLPALLSSAPLAKIEAPSGGTTIDSQSRDAINTIIARLVALGLTSL